MLTYTYIREGNFGLTPSRSSRIPIRSHGSTRRMSCLKISAAALLRLRWSVKKEIKATALLVALIIARISFHYIDKSRHRILLGKFL